jgi:hypothetical protein
MYLDAILEVAIGLIFSWLILSIATMQLQEWISSLFGWRGELLEDSLKRMLQDDELVAAFYNQPLISSLSQSDRKPSYIPSDRFAQSLFDVIINTPLEALPSSLSKLPQLQDIKGIGPESVKRLSDAGISTIEQLSNISPDKLRKIIHPNYEHIANEEDILKQASDLLDSDM